MVPKEESNICWDKTFYLKALLTTSQNFKLSSLVSFLKLEDEKQDETKGKKWEATGHFSTCKSEIEGAMNFFLQSFVRCKMPQL